MLRGREVTSCGWVERVRYGCIGSFPAQRRFGWQNGYGAFAVSKSGIPELIRYIQNQREHHSKMTFQEEYLRLLKKHGVEYDERYLWG